MWVSGECGAGLTSLGNVWKWFTNRRTKGMKDFNEVRLFPFASCLLLYAWPKLRNNIIVQYQLGPRARPPDAVGGGAEEGD